MKQITVKVDGQLCIGAAACVATAPKLFRLDEDNIALLVDPVSGEEKSTITFMADDEDLALIKEAVGNCPTSAISLE